MEILKIINERRAFRALEHVEITDKQIDYLAEAVSKTASCFNMQPWNFVFVRNNEKLGLLKETLAKGNEWAKKSSMIVGVFSKKDLDCQLKNRNYYLFDTGMATAHLILTLTEMKLVAHPIAGYNETEAKKVLDIPEEMKLITLVIVGKHSSDFSELNEQQLDNEKNRPERKPKKDFLYFEKFTN